MMEHKGYLARVEFDAGANIFHGEIINTRDVITFQGESVQELKKAFEDSVEDYMDFCAERGEKPDAPFTGRLMVQLPPDQHKKIVLAAEKAGKNVDSWITEVLTQAAY